MRRNWLNGSKSYQWHRQDMWLHPSTVEWLSNEFVRVKKSSQTFLDGYLTGYRGVSKCDWSLETIHTRAFLPVILSQKLIQLCLSITRMDPTTLKRPIALLAPMCATA